MGYGVVSLISNLTYYDTLRDLYLAVVFVNPTLHTIDFEYLF